jgi:hypothetical protein
LFLFVGVVANYRLCLLCLFAVAYVTVPVRTTIAVPLITHCYPLFVELRCGCGERYLLFFLPVFVTDYVTVRGTFDCVVARLRFVATLLLVLLLLFLFALRYRCRWYAIVAGCCWLSTISVITIPTPVWCWLLLYPVRCCCCYFVVG